VHQEREESMAASNNVQNIEKLSDDNYESETIDKKRSHLQWIVITCKRWRSKNRGKSHRVDKKGSDWHW